MTKREWWIEGERRKKNQAEYVIMVTCVCRLFLANNYFVYVFLKSLSVLSLRLASALVFATHSIWFRFSLSLSPYRFLTDEIFYARRQAKRKWSDIFYTVTLYLMPIYAEKKLCIVWYSLGGCVYASFHRVRKEGGARTYVRSLRHQVRQSCKITVKQTVKRVHTHT